MAKKAGLPNAMDRRHLLYGAPKRAPDFQALGDKYLAKGIRNDALESYEKIPDEAQRKQAISRVKQEALKDGVHFILNRIHIAYPLTADEWLQAAENARKAGKLRYALKSAREAGAAGMVAELELELGIAQPEPEPAEEGEGEGEAAESEGETAEGEGEPAENEGEPEAES